MNRMPLHLTVGGCDGDVRNWGFERFERGGWLRCFWKGVPQADGARKEWTMVADSPHWLHSHIISPLIFKFKGILPPTSNHFIDEFPTCSIIRPFLVLWLNCFVVSGHLLVLVWFRCEGGGGEQITLEYINCSPKHIGTVHSTDCIFFIIILFLNVRGCCNDSLRTHQWIPLWDCFWVKWEFRSVTG